MDLEFTKDHKPLDLVRVWEDVKNAIIEDPAMRYIGKQIYVFGNESPDVIVYSKNSGSTGIFEKKKFLEAVGTLYDHKIFNNVIKDSLPEGYNTKVSPFFAVLKQAGIIQKY
jgi:hypothetical protein